MKTIQISRESRLFKFAVSWGRWNYYLKPDICAFRRALVCGAIKMMLACGFLAGIYFLLSYSFYEKLVQIPWFEHPAIWAFFTPIVMLAGIIAVCSVVGLIFMVFMKAFHAIHNGVESKMQDSTISMVYKSWKDKFCTKVELR